MSDVVRIICPNLRCRKILSVPALYRGRQVKCQHCQSHLRVPDGGRKEETKAK